jgi:hypothetical protein
MSNLFATFNEKYQLTLKKFVATIMLAIYLFSIGGQLIVHQYFSYLSDRYFERQTDKRLYNVGDLFEVKLPVSLNQITDWKEFENITGQIQFENISYNYVKMKLTRTAIYLWCVPNYKTTHIVGENVICAQDIKSHPVQPKNHIPVCKFVLLNQLSAKQLSFEFSSPKVVEVALTLCNVKRVKYDALPTPDRPPRAVC